MRPSVPLVWTSLEHTMKINNKQTNRQERKFKPKTKQKQEEQKEITISMCLFLSRTNFNSSILAFLVQKILDPVPAISALLLTLIIIRGSCELENSVNCIFMIPSIQRNCKEIFPLRSRVESNWRQRNNYF